MNTDIFLFIKAMVKMNLIEDIDSMAEVFEVLKTEYNNQLDNLAFFDSDYDSHDHYYYAFDWDITNICNIGIAEGTTKELVIDAIAMTINNADSNDEFVSLCNELLNVSVIHADIFDNWNAWQLLKAVPYEKTTAILTAMTKDINSIKAYLTERIEHDYKFKNTTKILIEWSFINNGNVEFESINYLLDAGMSEKDATAYMVEFIEGFDNIADLIAFIVAIN